MPVVVNGKIVGIVSRANLIQALVSLEHAKKSDASVDDQTLHGNIVEQLRSKSWVDPSTISVVVNNGTVELWGIVDSETEKDAIRVAVEVTPGVRQVARFVMRWEPATDNSGQIQYYSIWIDGQAVKVLGGKTFEYYVGPAITGDTHVYRVQAVDGSGNGGPLSNAFTGVPDVVGLTVQQARDVLTSRGFTVGSIANATSGGAVISQNPSAPGYAGVGSAIDLKLNAVLRAPLALHVVGTKRLNLLTRHYTAVRVQVNMSSTITASLTMNQKLVTTWTRNVKSGTWILRYALPRRLAPGNYKLTVAAVNGGERKASTIRLRVKNGQILLGGKARVLVVGSGTSSMKLVVPKAKVTVTSTSTVYDTTFWSRNVAVVVVDIDKQGAAIVHNLHTVFPSVRIVAVTKYPAKVEKARRFGASAVILGGTTTPQIVSTVVRSLLSGV